MSSLLPIGQFVQLTGLSARMVRFYEKLGILLPIKVETHNSYRYYDYQQTMQAEKIRLLRSLEMPLEQIKQLLHEPNPQQVRTRLEQHRQHIEDKIASYRKALAALEMLENNQGTLYPIQVKQVPGQIYLSIGLDTTLSQVDWVRKTALEQLQRHADSQGQSPTGPAFAILRITSENAELQTRSPDLHHYEFGLPMGQVIPTHPPITLKRLPERTVASATHLGPYEPLHLVFRELNLWCHQQSRIFAQGFEVYQVGPLQSNQPEHYKTEVQFVLEAR